MCLRLNSNIHTTPEPFVATEDIKVWKVLIWNSYFDVYYSLFICVPYKLNQLVKAEMKITHNHNYNFSEVNEGIHAYTSERIANLQARNKNWNFMAEEINEEARAIPATIPKGSKYYIGIFDEIVSDVLYVHKGITHEKITI